MIPTILRLPAVLSACGLSRSTIYSHIQQGIWTKPVRIGYRAVGWPSNEVESLISARIAAKSNEDISALVKRLEAARIN